MTLPETFQGYRRASGRAGIRNRLLILCTCGLNAAQALKVAAALPEAALVLNLFGRGQVGDDLIYSQRMMRGFATHPNIGAVLVLAPDEAMRATYQDHARAAGRLAEGVSLEGVGEDGPALIARAIDIGHALTRTLDATERQDCPMSDLVLALECGHSDAYSGIVTNPLAGDLADAVVAAGGSAVFSETLEWLGTEPYLAARCRTPEIGARLLALAADRRAIAETAGKDLRIGNPGPQNHAGGLTTLEEKSLGAIRKGGTTEIVAALAAGETITEPGLNVMDTPTLSPESISAMVAAGAQLLCFTTGAGNAYGSAVAPTLKLTGNPDTATRLPNQIDAVATLSGDRGLAALLTKAVAICEGAETAAERAGETFEVISRLGPSV